MNPNTNTIKKSYSIYDKWTDLDKVNIIEINTVNGIVDEITINGEPLEEVEN